MPALGPATLNEAYGSPPFGQVASSLTKDHAGSLLAHGTTVQVAGTTVQIFGEAAQVTGTAAQVAGITLQIVGEAAQVTVFGAGAPKTTKTKASDHLFRSLSGEDSFPPIFQVANEMTERKPRQARRAAGSRG